MSKTFTICIAVLATIANHLYGANLNLPHSFSNGEVADANQVNANFVYLLNTISGSGNATSANLHAVSLSGNYLDLVSRPTLSTWSSTSGNTSLAGNVGIGTSDPVVNFHVSGNSKFEGDLDVSQDLSADVISTAKLISSKLVVDSELANFEQISSNMSLSTNSHAFLDASSSNLTLTLPDATLHSGLKITLTRMGIANDVHCNGVGSQANLNLSLSEESGIKGLTIMSDGSTWYRIGHVPYLASPQDLVAVSFQTSLSLSWTNKTTASNYELFRSSSENSGYDSIYTGSANYRVDSELGENSTYYYKVRSTDMNEISLKSSALKASTVTAS